MADGAFRTARKISPFGTAEKTPAIPAIKIGCFQNGNMLRVSVIMPSTRGRPLIEATSLIRWQWSLSTLPDSSGLIFKPFSWRHEYGALRVGYIL